MIVTRLLYFIFRFAQFVCSTVVMGLSAYFIHRRRNYGEGPYARLIYTLIVAVLGLLVSLFTMLPFTSNILSYTLDLVFSAAFFAAFGLLVNWIHRVDCGSAFQWGGLTNGSFCSQWKAAGAFSFLAAIFFLVSMLLGIYTTHKLRQRETVAAAPARRRGLFSRRRV